MMVQLVCNEVRLVNSHHSNKFSGAETMKHGCLEHGQRPVFLQFYDFYFVKISQTQNTNTKPLFSCYHLQMFPLKGSVSVSSEVSQQVSTD